MNASNASEECYRILSSEEAESHLRSSADKIFLIIFPFIVPVGFVLNMAFVFVIYRVKEMHTVTNVYLGSLAAADLGVLLTMGTQYLTDYVRSPLYNLGQFAFRSVWSCTGAGISRLTMYNASIFFVTMVLYERYQAVCYPLQHRAINDMKRAARSVVIIWMISLCMGILGHGHSTARTLCIEQSENEGERVVRATMEVCVAFPYALWLILLTDIVGFFQFLSAGLFGIVMIFRIVYALRRRHETIHSNTVTKSSVANTSNQVTQMLIVNTVVFFTCLTPLVVHEICHVIEIVAAIQIPQVVSILWCSRVLVMLNSSINPVVYGMANRRYRDAFAQALWC